MEARSILKSRQIVFGGMLALLIVFDFIKYQLAGFPAIINWQSFWHPGWVIVALILFWTTILLNKKWLWRFSFLVYFLVFLAALLNQYIYFWEVLTYNCMLFNLVFTAVYFFSVDRRRSAA